MLSVSKRNENESVWLNENTQKVGLLIFLCSFLDLFIIVQLILK